MLKRRRTTCVTSSQSLTQPNVQTPEEPQVMRRSHRSTRSQTKSQFESDPLSQPQSDSDIEQISAELHHSPESIGQIQGLIVPSEELCDGKHNQVKAQTSTGPHQEAQPLQLSITDVENTPQLIEQVRNLGDSSTITIADLSGESKGGIRGFTRLKRVWNLPEGYKVGVQFNSSFWPVGREGGLLMRFLGTCVRRPDIVPINFKTWLKVTPTIKEELWDLIKSKFEIPIAHENEVRRVLLQKAGYMWRGFKSNLKSHYFDEGKSMEEMIANLPPRVDQEQWASLVALWNTSDMKTLSENNKALRKLQKIRHTSGAKSFAEVAQEMKEKDGVEPSEEELYLLTHKRKDGTALNEDTAKKIAEIEKLMAQRQDNNPQNSNEDIEGQHDANDGGEDTDSDYAGIHSKVVVESNKDKRDKGVIKVFSTPSTSDLPPIDAIAKMVCEDNTRHVDEERITAHDDRSQDTEKGKRVEEDKRRSLGSVPSRKTWRSPLIVASARIVAEKNTRQVDEEERIKAYEEGRKQLEEERKRVEEDRRKVEEEKKQVEEQKKQVEEERRQAREDRRKAEEERDKSEAEIKFLKDRLTWMETLVSRLLPSTGTAPPKEAPNGRSEPINRMRMSSETSSQA